MKKLLAIIIIAGLVLVAIQSCSSAKKARRLEQQNLSAMLALGKENDYVPDLSSGVDSRTGQSSDTLEIIGENGERMYIMKAVKDNESGEMVASEVIDAAVVTSRFKNVAERMGKVEIRFQIIVLESMQDTRWQLRFYPRLAVLSDTLGLEKVIITGGDYRRNQLRGYERYNNWLSGIVEDSTRFINAGQLEIFVKRNIPELYAMKTDSTIVSDEKFASIYGVTEKEAVEHYTNKIARSINDFKKASRSRKFKRFVKVPIMRDGLRLDTVMRSVQGDFIYDYVQTITTVPKLRKADVLISGEIFEQDRKVYSIPESEPLTFYISSLSAFVDEAERYKALILERRVEAEASYYLEFASASSELDLGMGNNASEMRKIRKRVAEIIENEVFDLDSIVVTSYASPEGNLKYNESLSRRRSASITSLMQDYVSAYRDSLNRAAEEEISIDFQTGETRQTDTGYAQVSFISRSAGENWELLDALVKEDSLMYYNGWSKAYFRHERIRDLDRRETMMRQEIYYPYLRKYLYPRLRKVDFNFHLHRKGMVKDTIHTNVIDTMYMTGVQAIRDRDYEKAVEILSPYQDYNLAVAYIALDKNASALKILSSLKEDSKTPMVNYLLAIIYSRNGNDRAAVQCYLDACRANPSYVHRGNLDPEISGLIKRYSLNRLGEEETIPQ